MPRRQLTCDGYTRNLVEEGERKLILSLCDYCGLVIVGSVPKLKEEEDSHRLSCKKRKRAHAS